MNKISKNIILLHARNYRKIQENQVDPIIEYISQELSKMFPGLGEQEYEDWSCDIINCSSNQEVVEVLERLGTIHTERNFKCTICGENTYEVDIDGLIGTDHISCVIKKECKERPKDPKLTIGERLDILEEHIKRLSSYEDLSNRIKMLEEYKNM